ncbi:MAG: ribosomal protein [Candidatus Parcubacteria bacterium]|jgi:large subunit ribosomal protein L23
MSFLDRLKQKKTTGTPRQEGARKSAPKKAEATPKKEKEATTSSVTDAGSVSKVQGSLLLRPHVSEKAATAADRGIYIFDVPVTANKVEVRKAVEAMYKVNVAAVRTIRGIGKTVRRAAGSGGRRNRWKKALVELKKGQTINLVEGV